MKGTIVFHYTLTYQATPPIAALSHYSLTLPVIFYSAVSILSNVTLLVYASFYGIPFTTTTVQCITPSIESNNILPFLDEKITCSN